VQRHHLPFKRDIHFFYDTFFDQLFTNMKPFALSAVAALAALLPTALAQTHTDCYPLNVTGCPSMQALGGNATFIFNKTGIPNDGKVWLKQNNGKIDWDAKGGTTFTVAKSGDSPTVQSKFYMLFGRLEVVMKAAGGQGIVSSAILQSEALDEIDWEFLGNKRDQVLTNYYGKGNTTMGDRGKDFKMDTAPQDEWHNYTIDWTKERIQWWLDGKMLRELLPTEALNGKNYPQTPMNVRLGMWAGGDPKHNNNGTIDWAGGETKFEDGPFTMMVQTVYAQDYTEAKEYSWPEALDPSGSWDKIQVTKYVPHLHLSKHMKLTNHHRGGKSEVLEEIQSPSGVRNRYNALSQGAKIGIISGSLGFAGICVLLIAFCCIKQRRAGRKEHNALLAQEQKDASELQEYKSQMQSGKFGFGGGYNRV
jgi:hypothetical protein